MSLKRRSRGVPTIARTQRLSTDIYEFIKKYSFDRNMTYDLVIENILIDFREKYIAEFITGVPKSTEKK